MSQIELLRQLLYKEIELGNLEKILCVSQQLDELILCYTLNQVDLHRSVV
ncbi:MAG: Spo0E family sporulation regulatory protein-aspartic acid phosphatase [Clostridia bacterium]|nr:Spo0E family sporulation regulatory protein-aspartic acid phosphatase [Clostridia bacterium]